MHVLLAALGLLPSLVGPGMLPVRSIWLGMCGCDLMGVPVHSPWLVLQGFSPGFFKSMKCNMLGSARKDPPARTVPAAPRT